MLMDFAWPATPEGVPTWKGDHFTYDHVTRVSFLSYEKADSNWSEQLTTVHEMEVGNGDHPIDQASRQLAMCSVEQHLLARAGTVLEIGCSSGYLLRELKTKFPRQPVIGSDYLPGPLHKLSASIPDIPLLQFDLKHCPLPDNSLSAVISLNVLEHIDDDEQALRQIYRILQPGGMAHIEVPAAPSCYDIYDEYLMHCRRYTMQAITGKARKAGFEVLRKTHLGALVFPAFYLIKRLNRRKLKLPAAEKAARVHHHMRSTRRSFLMKQALRLELCLGRLVSYPAGVRCILVLIKPLH